MSRNTVVQWDVDEAKYLGDGEDGVYWLTGKNRKGYYVTIVVDSNTGGFVMDIETDAGPFETEQEADDYGKNAAADWCIFNQVNMEDE